jgi:hypothetical protein|tara:strand:+ start:123 stop:599 length:477 start_codon:yes stop_codon:yes gene_type:complete
MKGITFSQEKSTFGHLVFFKNGSLSAELHFPPFRMAEMTEWYLELFLAATGDDRCGFFVEILNSLIEADNGLPHIKALLPLPETISKLYELKLKHALDEAFKTREKASLDRIAMRKLATILDAEKIPPAARNVALAWAYDFDVSTVKRYLKGRSKLSE